MPRSRPDVGCLRCPAISWTPKWIRGKKEEEEEEKKKRAESREQKAESRKTTAISKPSQAAVWDSLPLLN